MRKPVQGFPIRQGLLKIRRRSIFKNNNLFEIVKRNITTRQTAEAYGFQPNRSSMICCPFHADRNPSMKVDSRFHCFGCGADGDVIDFTAKLFQLSLRKAAEKLVADFGLSGNPVFHYSIRKLWNIKVKTQSKHCTSAARFWVTGANDLRRSQQRKNCIPALLPACIILITSNI